MVFTMMKPFYLNIYISFFFIYTCFIFLFVVYANDAKETPPKDEFSLFGFSNSSNISCDTLKQPPCSTFNFPYKFKPKRVSLEDFNLENQNFLFRSNLPLKKETGFFNYEKLKKTMQIRAESANLTLPEKFDLRVFPLLWDVNDEEFLLNRAINATDNERCYYAAEKCYFILNPSQGTITHWPINGINISPYSITDVQKRIELAKKFDQWDSDKINDKIEYLHFLIHPTKLTTNENTKIINKEEKSNEEDKNANNNNEIFCGNKENEINSCINDAKKSNINNNDEEKSNEKKKTYKENKNNGCDQKIPIVAVFHCRQGENRTGQLSGAYNMRYNGQSLQDVWIRNQKFHQKNITTINHMMWQCLFLENKLQMETVKCYNILGESHAKKSSHKSYQEEELMKKQMNNDNLILNKNKQNKISEINVNGNIHETEDKMQLEETKKEVTNVENRNEHENNEMEKKKKEVLEEKQNSLEKKDKNEIKGNIKERGNEKNKLADL